MIHLHQSLYRGDVHIKQSLLISNTFQAVYEDSVIMYGMLQTFTLQNSSLNLKSTKHENVTHFINGEKNGERLIILGNFFLVT